MITMIVAISNLILYSQDFNNFLFSFRILMPFVVNEMFNGAIKILRSDCMISIGLYSSRNFNIYLHKISNKDTLSLKSSDDFFIHI